MRVCIKSVIQDNNIGIKKKFQRCFDIEVFGSFVIDKSIYVYCGLFFVLPYCKNDAGDCLFKRKTKESNIVYCGHICCTGSNCGRNG